MMNNKFKILGVGLDNYSTGELYSKISQILEGSKPAQIATVNPEFLLLAKTDEQFRNTLNQADLALVDGFGMQIAGWVKGCHLHRHTGADLTTYLLRISAEKNLKVAIINWRLGLSTANDIKTNLKKLYPNLNLEIIDIDKTDSEPDLTIIKSFQPDILFCTLGAPWQEELLQKIITPLNVKLGIGVGGSFDFITGKAKRSPVIFRKMGLEWLWRLFINPKPRAKRIFNAVIKFPIYFIIDDMIKPVVKRKT